MTRWEERIADILLERFPRSAAASRAMAPAGKGRPFRLRLEQLFPDFETSPPDEKESFLEAVEALEQKGLARASWVPRRRQEALTALSFPDPQALFAAAGKPQPLLLAEEGRRAALDAAEAGGPYREFFRYLAGSIGPVDAMRGVNARAVGDFAKLAAHIAAECAPYPGGAEGFRESMTTRALSIALYSDSKRLEEISSLFTHYLNAAKSLTLAVPDLSHLDRSFPETMIAGKLRFFFRDKDALPMTNAAGAVLGFPLASVRRLGEITPADPRFPAEGGGAAAAPTVLMIENKETFYVVAARNNFYADRSYDALLYIGGHPNRAAGAMVSLLAASGFAFYHSGDLDVEGILILQELAAIAGKPVTPLSMDAETFDRYQAYGRKLEASMLRRISLISEATRRIPAIAGLLQRIEATALGIEQEITPGGGAIAGALRALPTRGLKDELAVR